MNGKSFLIDPSIDLRQQALRAKIPRLDAVLITHPHSDHIGGLDELRSFNFAQRENIPLYGNQWTIEDLGRRFDYIFNKNFVSEGGGIPQLTLNPLPDQSIKKVIQNISVTLLPVKHGSKDCLGFRIEDFAYVTDTQHIPDSTLNHMRHLKVLVLDCVRNAPHRTHLHLDAALKIIDALKPKKTYLTHLNHELDYIKTSKKLPKSVFLAYDGLKIKI